MYNSAFNNHQFNLKAITTRAEVKLFADYLVNGLDINIHPDTPFEDYVDYSTQEPVFCESDVAIGNRLMDECFDVCGEDAYRIMCDVLFERIGLGTEYEEKELIN